MATPLVIAHRGASAREAENSLAAFRLAATLGADAVELDVHATADGHLVVHHDEMVGRHHIAHCSLAEVRHQPLRNGEPIPTLREALDVIVPGMIAFIEIKAMAQKWDELFFEHLDRFAHVERIAIHSFDHRIVHRLGEERPRLSRGVLSSSYTVHPARVMEDADASALWQHAPLVDRALVEKVHAAEGLVYAWTVDDPEQMQRLLDMGVDGLCTNHPDRARALIDSMPS
jgi:glycerophosphoryl diester phosphodiesterase